MKKIVVLGGSFLQSLFIKNALKSCEVYVFDGNHNCYAHSNNLGKFILLDFSNELLVKEFCLKNNIESILAPVNEFGNIIASRISEELGLLYNSANSVNKTSDKSFYHKVMSASNLLRPKSYDIQDIENISFPVIVKPTQSTSSKGVSLVYDINQISQAIEVAKQNCKDNNFKIEQFIEGKQFSIETISTKGKHHIVAVIEEHLNDAPFFFERTDFFDKDNQNELKVLFKDYIDTLLNLFGIKVGPCHIEVKLNESGIFLIDIASRSGGWRDIMLSYAGINYNQLILDSYLGIDANLKTEISNFSVGAGILVFEKDNEKLLEAENSNFFKEKHINGNLIKEQPKSLADAFGYYFVAGESRSALSKLLPIKIN
jgi:predicted ATP-grasp superfamily ATP-dependent carboligase